MTVNTSTKICISKRLTITSLLLIAVGFSVVVFSTLSSSVNKTTSSKAEETASSMMQDFGGPNNPCKYDQTHNPKYYCNEDTNLVCHGTLDFWLSNEDTKKEIRRDRKTLLEKGPKCVDPANIPMGGEGQICRPIGSVKGQCDSGVCVTVMDKAPDLTPTYLDYFNAKYKDMKTSYNSQNYMNIATALQRYAHINTINNEPGQTEPNGICIPEVFSKVESCGDIGQKACYDGQKPYCFDNNRPVVIDQFGKTRCSPKINVGSKGFFRCDDQSETCSGFCSKQGAKCVDSCDKKVLERAGDEYYEVIKKKVGSYGDWNSTGACDKEFLSGQIVEIIPLSMVCKETYQTYCCCDKK